MDALLEEYLQLYPPRGPDLTTEEALQHAEAEGLVLHASSKAGYVGVSKRARNLHPYQAQIGTPKGNLGYYATAAEAALVYARAARDRSAAGSAAR